MIYSRFGCNLTIIGYCGKHQPKGYAHPMMLVRAIRSDDDEIRHYFVFTLKADGGEDEIEVAIDAAPEIKLSGKELKDAIHEAL